MPKLAASTPILVLRFVWRYIEFNDRLEVDELHIPLYNLLIATADNTLIGPQVGADLKLFELGGCCPDSCGDSCGSGIGYASGSGIKGIFGRGCCRFRINSTINFGVMYNKVYHDPYSPYIGPPLVSEANEVALMAEVGLGAKFRVANHVAIRAGYNIMALHNVALAPDQIATSDVVAETATTKMGSLITHGASFGLELFW